MRLVIHQALKDVRLLRWLLLGWVLVLAAFHAVTLYVLAQPWPDAELLRNLETAEDILSFAGTAAFIVTAAFLVQSDSPVTTTDFWVTRPISGGTMLASKLLTGIVILWALPILGTVIDLLAAGIDIRALGVSQIAFQLAWLLPLMAIAACTVGLSQFVLVAIIEVLLVAILSTVTVPLGNWRRASVVLTPLFIRDIFAYTVIALAIPLVVYPYLTRQARRAAVLLGIAPAVVAAVVGLVVYAVADAEATTGVALRSVSITVDPAAVRLASRGDGTTIDVPLTIAGVPDGTRLGVVFDKAWLRAGSGRIDLGELSTPRPLAPGTEATGEVTATLRPALAGARLLPAAWNVFFESSRRVTLIARSRDLQSLSTAPAFLHLELRAWLTDYRPVAETPVRAGAHFAAGSRSGQLLDVQVDRDRVMVTLREAEPYDSSKYENFHLLRNLSRKEAIVLTGRAYSWFNWNLRNAMLPVSSTLFMRWSRFDANLPSGWLDDAHLIVIERQPERGDGTKTIEVPVVLNRQ